METCDMITYEQTCKTNPIRTRVLGYYNAPENHAPTNILLNKLSIDYDYKNYSRTPGEPIFFGTNQKLIDTARAYSMGLDRPNLTADIPVGDACVDQIYTPQINQIGKPYHTYNDIEAGQIQYYIDKSTAYPYFSPVFVIPAVVEKRLIKDPMDVIKPEYNRIIKSTKYNWDFCTSNDCNSFTHDSLAFREDVTSRQMTKQNQTNYTARWC